MTDGDYMQVPGLVVLMLSLSEGSDCFSLFSFFFFPLYHLSNFDGHFCFVYHEWLHDLEAGINKSGFLIPMAL